MMLKKKTPKMVATKSLLSIPVLFFALLLLSSPAVARMRSDLSDIKIIKKTETDTTNNKKSGNDEPVLMADVMPTFTGGDVATFRTWVLKSVKYPPEALSKKISGRVIISFVIEKNGEINDINILQSPDQSLSDEVIRVLKLSPKWTPAKKNGKKVRLKYTIPIEFSLK